MVRSRHSLRLRVGRLLFASALAATAASAQVKKLDDGPDVLEITGPVLAAFEKGLRAEIALREALRQRLAAPDAAKAQHEACLMDHLMKPETQKFNEALGTVVTKAPPAEALFVMQRFAAAQQTRLEKACGLEPPPAPTQVSAAQLEAIEQKAVSVAGPIPPGAKAP